MLRLRPFLAFIVSMLCSAAAALDRLTEPLRAVWPDAFPATSPSLRSLGVWLSIKDAKPAARRVADYQIRVAQRHQHDRRAIAGLILAV